MLITKYSKRLNILFKVLVMLFLAGAVLSLLDIYADIRHNVSFMHIFIEAIILAANLMIVFLLLYKVKTESIHGEEEIRKEILNLNNQVHFWEGESARFLNALKFNIIKQFDLWSLSKSEREVASLLIKGFSSKEIAKFRGTSERTIRQQAGAIYRKSSLAGRSELASYFLNELFSFY